MTLPITILVLLLEMSSVEAQETPEIKPVTVQITEVVVRDNDNPSWTKIIPLNDYNKRKMVRIGCVATYSNGKTEILYEDNNK